MRHTIVILAAITFPSVLHAQCPVRTPLPLDGAAGDEFGVSVDIDGDTAIVGAGALFGDDSPGTGAAYVFQRDEGGASGWQQVVKLTPADGAPGDNFGFSVAIDGDLAVVGAYKHDAPAADAGAAYVFRRHEGGPDAWGQVARLTASDAAAFDWFGLAVDVDGDTIAVGAQLHDHAGLDRSGAVYVFRRDQGGAGNWGEVAEIVHETPEAIDGLGFSVAISGDTLIAGAIGDDEACGAAGCEAGAAYVFVRDQGGPDQWGQVAKLVAGDGAANDLFGFSLALHRDTAVIGALWHDHGAADAGAAYVFARHAGGANQWEQISKLVASDPLAGAEFGGTVAIDDARALVGALHGAWLTGSTGAPGEAYLFAKNTGGLDAWGQTARLRPDAIIDNDVFGRSVALSCGTAALGAPRSDLLAADAGAAWIVDLAGVDCNGNGICDTIDILDGTSPDLDGGGVPDECETDTCPGDVDDDGTVSVTDLLTMLAGWGACP